MKFRKIRILKETTFKPHKKASKKLIRTKMRVHLEKFKKEVIRRKLIFNTIWDDYEDIKVIAKEFKVHLIITKSLSVGGMAGVTRRKIFLYRNSTLTPFNKTNVRRTFCHELAHILQGEVKLMKNLNFTLSEALRDEQEADAVAIELFRIFWPNQRVCRHKFNNYFDEKSIIWLGHFFKTRGAKFVNDLYVLKDGKTEKRRKAA